MVHIPQRSPGQSWLQWQRLRLRFYLNDIETPLGVAINLLITGLVLLSTAIFVAQTYPVPAEVRVTLDMINAGILWLFVAEYTLRWWSAESRLKFMGEIYSLIDLVTVLPFLIGLFDVSFIRIFRWFRILRLIRFLEGKALSSGGTVNDSPLLARILFTLFAIVFVYSGLIYQVEHVINPDQFRTFLDAFYFSIVTMTTVGFGDVTPISEAGRLLTVLMILTGVTLIPWQVGDLVRRLVNPDTQVEMPCPTCGLRFHDPDADFCKRCGTALPKKGAQLLVTSDATGR